MVIDKSGFLLVAGTLAAGGVGGWALRDRGAATRRPDPVAVVPAKPAPAEAEPVPSSVVVVDPKAAAPACDDNVGVPEECPSVGPSDEGVCPNIIFKRCTDYKAAFKPKVAQEAVLCLRRLQGNERCDAVRVNLCGHTALMAACPEPTPSAKGTYTKASAMNPPTVTLTEDANVPPSPVTLACQSIIKNCGGQPLSPSLTDCRQTLTGMNDMGRASMVECMATHCRDRGLLGCEAMQKVPGQAQQR